jgi:hypothetical protein
MNATVDNNNSLPHKAAEPCRARPEFKKQTPGAIRPARLIIVKWEAAPLCHPRIRTAKPPGPNCRASEATQREGPEVQPAGSLPHLRPLIRIFGIYEHDLNRDRARLLEKELAHRLGQCFSFLVSWWKLKSLWHPKMLQVAADHVDHADIILFSLRSGAQLPRTVTKWIEKSLLKSATRRVSLLALLETGGTIVPRLSPAKICVKQLSSKAGVDCLCYSESMPLNGKEAHGDNAINSDVFVSRDSRHGHSTLSRLGR